MVPPGREDEGRRAIACSYTGAAQAATGLGAFDEEQPFLDTAHGNEPRAKVRINGPSPSKVAAVVVDTVQGKFRASLRERTRDQVTDGKKDHN